MRGRAIVTTALAMIIALPVVAQVQSPWEFLGYEKGDRFTPYHRIVDYLEYLEAESPMLELETYGETWEGRPLTLAIIASPENIRRLDEIRTQLDRLADPRRTTADQAQQIASSIPTVVWLAFGVHGNESSSAEAAMVTAHWLLSPEGQSARDDVIVLIDPLQNPDGRARYVDWFRQKVGNEPNPNPEAVEHDEPWPGGRFNHYLVDMNRDWAWASQPEIRARIDVFNAWHPQVVVDFHEMFYNSTYFFPPNTAPTNLNIHPDVTAWLETFGRANAAEFSERGWPFFVREHFDLFYPGYGDSWPSLRGAIGMTYEVAGHGRAGLVIERQDGTTWTLAERIEQHATAAITTVRTAAANHEDLLEHTWSVSRTAMQDPKTFFLLDDGPPFHEAIDLLRVQGIEVSFLSESVNLRATRIGSGEQALRTFPEGTAVVNTSQPLGAFAKAVLEQNPVLPAEFVDRQRERVDADEYAEFYDLTGWSVPLAFNVETWQATGRLPEMRLTSTPPAASGSFSSASYGWLIDGLDPAVYRTAAAMHRAGVRFGIVPEEARVEGRLFAPGTLAILRYKNIENLDDTLRKIASDERVEMVPIEQGWVGELSLGSDSIERFVDPAILLVGGRGTSPTSFGSLWYTLDVSVDMPHTVVDLDSLSRVTLSDYRVIILPSGSGYEAVIGGDRGAALREWIRGGGTLVAIKGAAEALRGGDESLSEVEVRERKEPDAAEEQPGQKRYTDYHVPGAVFATDVRRRGHLVFGIGANDPSVMIEGTVALELAPYAAANIVTISKDAPLVAGIAWPESIETIAGSAWLTSERVGRGRIITFADEPHYRLFWKGTLPFLLNAVMYTPSFVN